MSDFDSDVGEGDSAEPTAQGRGGRSSLSVLKSLDGNPFKQAERLVKYLDKNGESRAKLIKACTKETLELVEQYHPGVL